MTVRKSYRLPHSLDTSPFDMAINLTSQNSLIQIRRQLTVRVLFLVLLGVLVYMALIVSSPIGKGGFLGVTVFTIGYFWLLWLLCEPTLTKRVGLNYILPAYRYIQPVNRQLMTRSVSLRHPVEDVIGIRSIDKKGVIHYTNGDVGMVLEVVGNASILMFDEDARLVLESANKFFAKLPVGVSLTYDYVIASQRVSDQIHALDEQRTRMQFAHMSNGLQQLNASNREILTDYVGGSFKSLHQYVCIRGKERSYLDEALQWVRAQVDSNTFYITQYRPIVGDELVGYLQEFYTNELVKK